MKKVFKEIIDGFWLDPILQFSFGTFVFTILLVILARLCLI